MPERRPATSSSSSTTARPASNVRRNIFHQHLSRRPTTSSTSTSVETLRLDVEPDSDSSEIVIRNGNGEFDVGDAGLNGLDELERNGEEVHEEEKERQRLAALVRHHQRDRNRAPSEPTELLEDVKRSLRAKVTALAEDNWIYEAEEEVLLR